MHCRACKTTLRPFLSLGNMPLANSFLTKSEISKEKKYDLTVGLCSNCYLVQLLKTVSPEKIFRKYLYFSSTSSVFLKHCDDLAQQFTKRFKLTSQDLVLEVGSNYGALLSSFQKLGVQTLGIDPARNIAAVANKRGVKTVPHFFNLRLANQLRKKNVRADLVYGSNILAHVPEIVDFVKGLRVILADQGTAVFEFPHLKGLLENKFDTIYHEHVFYYSLIALQNLFRAGGLEIYDVEKTSMQGGSLLIYASLPNVFKTTARVNKLIQEETKAGFKKIETYEKIKNNISILNEDLTTLLTQIKEEGKTVAVYSVPAKGNTLLNYFPLAHHVAFAVDKSPAKQGLYTPGTHFKVEHPDAIYQKKPDYLLVLCWNIAEEVIKEHETYKKNGGKFIIPIPKVKLI